MPNETKNRTSKSVGEIEIRRSSRTRRLSVTVYPTGRVRVSAPTRISERSIRAFLTEQADWIEKQVQVSLKKSAGRIFLPGGRRDYLKKRETARSLATVLLSRINLNYGFSYGRISIKNQYASWGSCSELGNLNFNYRIVYLPERLARYVIAHELCHRGEMNHSPAFWKLVARTVPDWRECRREIRKFLI